MALHSSSSGMFSLKNIALLSTGVLSFALLLKLSVPLSDFAASELPSVYSTVLSWLRPPYLYLVINCIIISIVASSKLQQQQKANDAPAISSSTSPVFAQSTHEFINVAGESSSEYLHEGVRVIVEEKDGVVSAPVEEDVVVKEGGEDDDRVVLGEKSKEGIVGSDSIEMLSEKVELKKEKNKPPASARFGHKKSLKASPDQVWKGGGLGVTTRSKRDDTLESTWKMITDGRPMPLTRHLKKSDTWDTHTPTPSPPNNKPTVNKSETFNETKSKLSGQGSGRLKREPSLGQDELNRRVEAFIKKFNEEMRLQRQASLNQYQEMIAREAY